MDTQKYGNSNVGATESGNKPGTPRSGARNGGQQQQQDEGGMGNKMNEAKEMLTERYGQAKEHFQKAATQLEDVVKEHPFASILAAAGAGWLVGKLFTRIWSSDSDSTPSAQA